MSDPSKAIPAKKRILRSGGDRMMFPSDLDQSVPYWTQISFVKYNRDLPNKPHTENTTGSILLPLPSRLPENYHMNYDQMAMSWRGMNNADAAKLLNDLGISGRGIGDSFGNWALLEGASKAIDAAGDIGGMTMAGIAAMVSGDTRPKDSTLMAALIAMAPKNFMDKPIGRAAANYMGKVPNPHMTTVFNGVNLRELTFEWQFTPRSEQESRILRDIRNSIKAKAHPTYDHRVSRFALNYPEQCYIEFKGAEEYLEPVHKCVIKDIIIESAPHDLAFYAGGAPVAVQMALTVQEVEIRTREDWDDQIAEDGSSFDLNWSGR